VRERSQSRRALAASYSAFAERSPCARAASSSLGSLTFSSYLRSASSFLSRAMTGSSMSASAPGGLGEYAARDLARLPAVEAAGEPLAQRAHDRTQRARRRPRRDGADGLLQLGGCEQRRHVHLEQGALGAVLPDQLAAAGLGSELLGLLALSDLPPHELYQVRLRERRAPPLDLQVLGRGDETAQHVDARHLARLHGAGQVVGELLLGERGHGR